VQEARAHRERCGLRSGRGVHVCAAPGGCLRRSGALTASGCKGLRQHGSRTPTRRPHEARNASLCRKTRARRRGQSAPGRRCTASSPAGQATLPSATSQPRPQECAAHKEAKRKPSCPACRQRVADAAVRRQVLCKARGARRQLGLPLGAKAHGALAAALGCRMAPSERAQAARRGCHGEAAELEARRRAAVASDSSTGEQAPAPTAAEAAVI